MASGSNPPTVETRTLILEAARSRLLADGYGLSTRKVAEQAGVPVSQLHYHFGSKGGLLMALFVEENTRLLERQTNMYAQDKPLWQRYEQACDFLEDDLESGYVQVLQEMIAAGWSNPAIGDVVRDLLSRLVRPADRGGPRGRAPSRPASRALHRRGDRHPGGQRLHRLGGAALLGFDRQVCRSARPCPRIGVLIREYEEQAPAPRALSNSDEPHLDRLNRGARSH